VGPADETLRFGLDGSEYQIDLSKKSARTFRNQLAPFVEHARTAGRAQRRRSVRTSPRRERSGDIRAWAKDKGIPVSARGRIPARVAEQYQTANR
jgi:Lsr2